MPPLRDHLIYICRPTYKRVSPTGSSESTGGHPVKAAEKISAPVGTWTSVNVYSDPGSNTSPRGDRQLDTVPNVREAVPLEVLDRAHDGKVAQGHLVR